MGIEREHKSIHRRTYPYCKDFKTAAKAGHGSNSSCAIFYSALSAAVAHPLMPPLALELVLSPGVASSLLVPPLALLALALSPGHYLQWLLVPEKSLKQQMVNITREP